jgi:hypothetical protein
MENKSYSLVKFLEKENIPFSNIWYFISDKNGKKKPIGEFNKITDANEIKTKWYIDGRKPPKSYYLGKEQINLSKTEQESLKFSVSIYLKASPANIYCLDIDDVKIKSIDDLISFDKKFEVFRGCPYLVGNTKGIHIYLKIDNLPIEAKELSVINGIDGDLIRKNNNMWERMDKSVLGGKKLLSFKFEDIKDVFNARIYGTIEEVKEKKKMMIQEEGNEEEKDENETNQIVEKVKSVEVDEITLQVLNLLKKKRFEHFDDWTKMLWAFKSCKIPFSVFNEFSRVSNKFNEDDNLRIWNSAKTSKDLTMGYLHFLAKTDSPKEYKEIESSSFNFFDEKEKGEWVKIKEKYLLKENQLTINDETILEKNINSWFSNKKIKSFNIKSPYGTGKTQMIKAMLNTFKFPRVLWLSYRKTLTNDLMGDAGFSEFGFQDYQTGKISSDRLIIQVESIKRLEDLMFSFDEVSEYPSYDLIIIDEIESVLMQFFSETFKNKSAEAFEFVKNVIFNSSKVLTLDGDLGNRAIEFVESFGRSINIRNEIQLNLREFVLSENEDYFLGEIEREYKEGKKCAVVSMTAKHCESIKEYFNKNHPQAVVLIYTGISDDSIKKELKKVKTIWNTCNILLYSPVIEAGVSFDIDYFDSIYGVLAESTTSRAFSQMLARIRKVKSNRILLLNTQFENHKVFDYQFYKFEEVKQSVLLLDNIQSRPQVKEINGKMCKVNLLTEYDINYIYNKCEKLNSTHYYFLQSFKNLMMSKGHTFKILNDNPQDKLVGKTMYEIDNENLNPPSILSEYSVSRNKLYVNAKDLTEIQYEELIEKQKRDEATKDEKLSISKTYYKKMLGVDYLDEKFLNEFTPNSINKFCSIIDINNISKSQDLHVQEEKEKAIQIRQLIKDLGFKNCFDTGFIIKSNFEGIRENIIKNNNLFTDFSETKIRFELNKDIKKIDGKAFNGFVNQLLGRYFLHLKYDQITKDKKKVGIYKLEQTLNINELLQYRIERGFKLEDSEKMRTESTTKAYKNLLFTFEDNAKNEWENWVQGAEIIDYEKEQVKYRAFKKNQKHYNTNGLDFGINDN